MLISFQISLHASFAAQFFNGLAHHLQVVVFGERENFHPSNCLFYNFLYLVCVCACDVTCSAPHNPSTNMLDSKKPSQLIKKLHSNEIELKVHLLDDSSHLFNVKVSVTIEHGSKHTVHGAPLC